MKIALLIAVLVLPQQLLLDQSSFTLSVKRENPEEAPIAFALKHEKDGKIVEIPLQREFLIPTEEEEAAESDYVTPYNFDSHVTAFPVGNNSIGIHLTSYSIQESGSAAAASGKDVFLLYVPESGEVFPGPHLGITRSRVRTDGCFSALYTTALISDINKDGLMDLGLTKEEMICVEEDGTVNADPFYQKHPTHWYTLVNNEWEYNKFLHGTTSTSPSWTLPGLSKSPVEFVKEILNRKTK
jgi:hypothetical protein